MPPDAEALSFYPVENPRVARNLHERLVNEQNGLVKAIAEGRTIDWPDYKFKVGIVRGLSMAMDILEKLEKEDREGRR